MIWDSLVTGSCESLIRSNSMVGYPEYANSFTSIFISFVGLWGLYASEIKSTSFRFIYSFLTWTGVGSFLTHYKGLEIYQKWDVYPMLFFTYMVFYKTWEVVLNYSFRGRKLDRLNDTWALFMTFCLTIVFSFNAVEGHPWGINLGIVEFMVFPQFFNAMVVIFYRLLYRDMDPVDITNRVFNMMWTGFWLTLIGGLAWGLTEPYCGEVDASNTSGLKYPWMRYMYAHAVWHIFATYGAHLILQSAIYFNSRTKNKVADFVEGENTLSRIMYKVFPIVKEFPFNNGVV